MKILSLLVSLSATACFAKPTSHVPRASLKPPRPTAFRKAETSDATTTAVGLRGGAASGNLVTSSLQGLLKFLRPNSDLLVLLGVTATNAPLSKLMQLSPILGFLALGLLLGPNGLSVIKDVHMVEHLADLGIVFFLFEMGVHLSLKTLWSIRSDVFGLGGLQFGSTAALVFCVARYLFNQSAAAAAIIGGGLALSSSAFVLQLLKDKGQTDTNYGQKSFGVLLLQDLMVVPLLVMTPILAPGGTKSVSQALSAAGVQIVLALGIIGLVGTLLLGPFFDFVTSSGNHEALTGASAGAILAMSMVTEGLGLSNTLGAFLTGVLLAENKHKHAIEHAVEPIRGILVGLFFFSVGFEIDLGLIRNKFPLVVGLALSIVSGKALLASMAAKSFGVVTPTARRLGLVLSQGGEFAFVAFRTARSYGILKDDVTKLLLTVVSLTMAVTPMLEDLGAKLEEKDLAPKLKTKRA